MGYGDDKPLALNLPDGSLRVQRVIFFCAPSLLKVDNSIFSLRSRKVRHDETDQERD